MVVCITIGYILGSSACGVCNLHFILHLWQYDMSKRYSRKGIVVSSTYMSFIGVRLGIKARILFY